MLTKDSVSTIEADILRQVLQLNVVAAAQLNKLLIPKMLEGSSVLYISSTLGTKAVANTHAYVVSKHAVIGQMRATCQDLAGKMIHTACVCPGFTETEMLQNHLKTNPELYDQLASRMALKRLAQPSEIADTLWFCSQNPVINGSVIHANLGQIEQ
jgi:NAD(P)-dependent dehydrogenase (short-subunit alcohol dehydrogenase family)